MINSQDIEELVVYKQTIKLAKQSFDRILASPFVCCHIQKKYKESTIHFTH